MPDHNSGAEIYVGYLPVPPQQRRFLQWSIPAVLWLVCGAAFLWARSQHEPGAAVWDDGKPVTLRGVLAARPYPILFIDSPSGRPEAVLLVEAGKLGGAHGGAALHGRVVSASGWVLHRDGRRILELEPEAAALSREGDGDNRSLPVAESLGRITLRGEIVDSKCFLGAMKPGEGKTHKECATLCIRGGIPPMLVTRDGRGATSYVLLEGPDGGPLEPAAHPLIGDVVELSGELSEWGGLRVLRVSATDIRRL
jgi:hypothetical protein